MLHLVPLLVFGCARPLPDTDEGLFPKECRDGVDNDGDDLVDCDDPGCDDVLVCSLADTDTGAPPDTDEPVNSPPVADAGLDQLGVVPGTLVWLDGRASSDPDGDPITYLWSLGYIAPDANTQLQDTTSATPRLWVDAPGSVLVRLLVSDGAATTEDLVGVRVLDGNRPPVARAGPDLVALRGTEVIVDGAPSYDPDGDALTATWRIFGRPSGAEATLSTEVGSTRASFVPDAPGAWTLELVVRDTSALASLPDTLEVQVR